MDGLAGKWVWLWNWRQCDGGDVERVAARLKGAGCRGALVKAFDGAGWFDQGRPWREIAAALRQRGLSVGGWGYCYGRDIAGEAERAIETARYGEADLLVLDVEVEFNYRGEAAQELCRRIREGLGEEYPLYFSSFALPRYHREFPFDVFAKYCDGAAPQLYWNAFGWPGERAIKWMYEENTVLGIAAERLFPVGGLYQEGQVRYPTADGVLEFVRLAAELGSPGVSFLSHEHMSEEMWQAVSASEVRLKPDPRGESEEDEMSSAEFEQVSRSVGELSERVGRLEAEMASLRGSPVAAQRTYTVQAGDTLSGIAAKLGVADWRRLYEANVGVIGGDPDLIRPGQVLVVG